MGLRSLFTAVALSGALGLAGPAAAADFVYLLQGPTDSIATGTITTDTDTGVLALSDIVDWNLTITVPGKAGVPLLGPLSGDNSTDSASDPLTALTATPSGLFWDFSTSQFLEFQQGAVSDLKFSFNISSLANSQDTAVATEPAANEQIATFAAVVAPEPATWVLMLAGLGAVGATLRRRKAMLLLPV